MSSANQPRFYAPQWPVPHRLQADEFTIVPLQPAHVELDYQALMRSKSRLRQWSGSAWPQDDFALADNLSDLEWHWQEHQERIAFTFTVLDQTESTCLGCVYMKPVADLVPAADEGVRYPEVGDDETAVRFWATTSSQVAAVEVRLLSRLADWFQTDWHFRRVYFHTAVSDTSQLDLFARAGLARAFQVSLPERGGMFEFWELV